MMVALSSDVVPGGRQCTVSLPVAEGQRRSDSQSQRHSGGQIPFSFYVGKLSKYFVNPVGGYCDCAAAPGHQGDLALDISTYAPTAKTREIRASEENVSKKRVWI